MPLFKRFNFRNKSMKGGLDLLVDVVSKSTDADAKILLASLQKKGQTKNKKAKS